MHKVTRFGVSVDTSLLGQFDELIEKLGYKSRSEAFRDLTRERLVSEEWKDEKAETLDLPGFGSGSYPMPERNISLGITLKH